jgi:PAS domain S-box-containing protein
MITYQALIFLDSTLLVAILSPALYSLVVSPLLEQINERSVAERALNANKIKYRQLIDSVEGIVWEADPRTFAFQFISQKAEEILGYPVERWIDEPAFWADHLHPEDRDWAIEFCVSASRELRNHVFEYRMIAADGSIVWLRDLVTIIVVAGEAKSLRGLMVDITEKKTIELALAASERRYQFLADNLHDVIWEMDATLCYTYISGSVSEMFGYRVEELVARPFGSVLSEQSRDKAGEILNALCAKARATGSIQEKINSEFECCRKDGSTFWVDVNATLIFTPDGAIKTVVGSTRDVSDRKIAENRLQAAHDLLQKTINSLNEAVIIVDAVSSEIVDVNRATEKMFAYSREELLKADFSLLHLSTDMYQRFSEDMRANFSSYGTFTTKFRMKRKSGWVFPGEQSVAPISADNGGRPLYVCVVRDISAQILHEEELNRAYNMVAERNAFVESVIGSIQSGIIVLDSELRLTMINPYAAEICRRDADELMGLSLFEISPELHEQVIQESGPDEMIATFFGARLIIGYACFHIRNVRGTVTGTILTFKDLTEIVRIRNEIRQKQRLSAMGEVVARVAHEMRNPLFGMTSAGQILNMELQLTTAQQVLMDSFLKESRRLNNLVDELLDSTREIRLNKRMLNLIDIINDSLRLVAGSARERRVALVPGDMQGEVHVFADPDKLEQVLLNLLKNGVEACDDGGCVDLSVSVSGTTVEVTVASAYRKR